MRDEEETVFGEPAARETLAPRLNVQSECTCVYMCVSVRVCAVCAPKGPLHRRGDEINEPIGHACTQRREEGGREEQGTEGK